MLSPPRNQGIGLQLGEGQLATFWESLRRWEALVLGAMADLHQIATKIYRIRRCARNVSRGDTNQHLFVPSPIVLIVTILARSRHRPARQTLLYACDGSTSSEVPCHIVGSRQPYRGMLFSIAC